MFGVPLEGAVNTFCDNLSTVTNSTQPATTIKKKHNSIAYYQAQEAVASNFLRIDKEESCRYVNKTATRTIITCLL